jgi:hypothetical protein
MGVGNDFEVATAIIEVVCDVMGLVRKLTISGGGGGGVLCGGDTSCTFVASCVPRGGGDGHLHRCLWMSHRCNEEPLIVALPVICTTHALYKPGSCQAALPQPPLLCACFAAGQQWRDR